jgi:CcmD family protein
MNRALPLFVLLLVVSLGFVAGADAQSQATGESPAASVDATGFDGALAQATPQGIPERPAFPRTLRDYWHLFIAYAVVWVLIFGYVISLGRRFGRMEEELERLRGA